MIFSRMVLVFTYEGNRYRTIHRGMSCSMRYSLVLLQNLKLHLFFKHTNARYLYINNTYSWIELVRYGTVRLFQTRRVKDTYDQKVQEQYRTVLLPVQMLVGKFVRTYIYNLFILFWNRKIWNYTIGVMNNGTVENTYVLQGMYVLVLS